ncbi:unnamed protein product [Fraxinus pennsylvanica]|uniref:Uncharacterized protein n=1 Tax=Fraxinus pennsylvanica TaxID=56036 RepID=A0AAD1Z408_9LAMI|nr:unnamed protein product [Fraxinus pennsylvanica]
MARIPIDTSQHISKNKGESVSQVEYSRIIENLMYLMSCIKPDIAYTVSKLSRYMSNSGDDHWKEIVRVLRYLRYTRNFGLHYTKYPTVIEEYSDANWISDTKDSKSTSGFVFTLGGADISKKSSKQIVIASRCYLRIKYRDLFTGEEGELLHNFLEDPRWSKHVPPICIYGQNLCRQPMRPTYMNVRPKGAKLAP